MSSTLKSFSVSSCIKTHHTNYICRKKPKAVYTPMQYIRLQEKTKMGENEKKGGGEQEGKYFGISVKISGEPLRQLMAIRADKEKETRKITSATEIVREAIKELYEKGATDD